MRSLQIHTCFRKAFLEITLGSQSCKFIKLVEAEMNHNDEAGSKNLPCAENFAASKGNGLLMRHETWHFEQAQHEIRQNIMKF